MNDDVKFQELAKLEAEGLATPEDVAYLEEDPARWALGLKALITSICNQAAKRKNDVVAGLLDRQDYAIWKTKAMTCKMGLEKRLAVLKLQHPSASVENERIVLGQLLKDLSADVREVKADIAELRDALLGEDD